jgi:hypothetical protein
MNQVILIEGEKLIINENILSIPELKKVYDKFKEPNRSLVFCYLHYLYDVNSPFLNLPETEREEKVRQVYKGDYKPNFDPDIIAAKEVLAELNYSPVRDMLEGLKININRISTFLKTAPVETGRDGSLSEMIRLQKEAQSMLKNYKAVEAEFLTEASKVRGKGRRAIDEDEL